MSKNIITSNNSKSSAIILLNDNFEPALLNTLIDIYHYNKQSIRLKDVELRKPKLTHFYNINRTEITANVWSDYYDNTWGSEICICCDIHINHASNKRSEELFDKFVKKLVKSNNSIIVKYSTKGKYFVL